MKKIVSLLLSIVMLVSTVACVDLSAFADDNDVTNRAEWLAELVETFDMSIESDNYPDNYFSDLTEDSEYYYDVLLAVEFGLIDIEAGDPVDPEGEITREFAAQTLNFCLKYQLEDADGEDYEYTFSDYEQCEYPYDDQVAVNRGWFELDEDDQFCPDQVVTSDEIDIMLTDARETIEGDEVDENYDSTYEYDNGVVEISSDTEVEFSDDNVIIIYDTDYSINSGDTIVVYSYGIPLVYDVEEVTVNSDNISVKVTDSSNENAIEYVDMQAVFNVNANDFIPGEGYEIIDETESVAYTNGIAPIVSSTPQENSVKISKKFEIDDDTSISIEIEISDIKLSVKENTEKQSITAKVEFDMSFIVDAEFDLTDLVFDDFDSLGIFGSIPIAGIGYVELKPDVNFGCKTELSQSYNVVLGFTKDNNGTHNISSFKKGSFTYVFEGSFKLGVIVEVGITILIAKIDMYAEIGVLAKVNAQTTVDADYATYCLTLSAYMYYNLGVEYEIDFAFWQSNGGIEWHIFGENNSPIRLYFHFEDGKAVDECMAGKQKYVSPNNTVYGGVSDGFSENYTSGSYGLVYVVLNNTATITHHIGYPENLYIPEYIDGYLVTEIGHHAFSDCDSLTSVRIPDSVKTISRYAFSNCESLTSVTLGKSVETIGYSAFQHCDKLISVTIPKSVKTIDVGAFEYCHKLTSVKIPDSVTSIGDYAFSGCESLTDIKISNNLTSIERYTFAYCYSLMDIIIPDSVEIIGDGAFTGSGLTSAIIPNSVKKIEASAFFDCHNLTNLTIGNGVETIGNSAFRNCHSLISVIIPDSVTNIDDCAFLDCSSLTSVSIPNSVTSIGKWAFDGCSNLKVICIMNEECDIYDNSSTISDDTIIAGYRNSTAQKYAENYDREFVAIDDYNCSENRHLYSVVKTFLGTKFKTKYTCVLCDYSYTKENIIPSISVGETKIVNIEIGGDYEYFVFVPEVGMTYDFYSTGDYDTYGYLYDENMNELKSNDDGDEDYNFYISYYLKQGKTYYFACRIYPSDYTGSFNVTLEYYKDTVHQHSYNSVITAPTCTEQGYTTHTCPECGDSYVDSYVAAKGHTPDSGTVTKAATCTATGTKTYKCTICGVTTKTETIAKTDHKAVTDKAVEATCTKDGKTAGSHCSVCGVVITAQTTVKAKGHSYDNGKVTKEATYTETGIKTYTCKTCGATKTETIAKKTAATPQLSAVTNTATGVKITWGKVSGAEKYRVFYKTANSGWTKIADTTSTNYTWTKAKSGTKYTFTVRCVDKDGKNYTSSYDSKGKTLTYIAAPKLSSVANSATGVTIKWDKSSGAAKYRIFYKTGNGSWTKIADTTSTSYTWTKAKSGTKYTFTVRCVDKDGKNFTSAYDTTGKSIKYIAAPKLSSVSNTATGVQIKWSKSAGAAKYRIFYKTANGKWTKIADTSSTSYTWTKAKSGTKYTFTVRCIDKDGNNFTSSYDSKGKTITYLSAPKISSLSKTSSGIQVKWGKVTGAVNYKVFRKTANGSWTVIGTTTGTSFVDKTAKKGTKYTYTVRCVSKDGKTYTSGYDATGKSITR